MAEIFNFYVQDNRTIQFPKNNLLEPIMQEDHNVAVWRFRIPKVLNAIDMSGYAWWFVYVNAGGQEFSELLTLVDDVDEPDSFCTADYSIDYGISYHPGNFQFSLEAINADSGGEVLNEWHTKTYAHKVDKTLQGNQVQWSETESDIISALIVEVQNKVRQLVGGATPEPKSLIADMTDTKKVYLYVGSETGESTNYWYYHNGSAWVAGGVYASGITVDAVPTQGSNNAVRSGGVYEALQSAGFSEGAKAALLACFEHVAWTDEHGQDYYDALESAFNNVYPKISALYTQGLNIIYTDEPLDRLKQYITVKYYINAESTGVIIAPSEYSLSGELTEGTNNIRVEYNALATNVSVPNVVDFYNIWEWDSRFTGAGKLTRTPVRGGEFVYEGTQKKGILYNTTLISGNNNRGFATLRGKAPMVTEDNVTLSEYYPIPVPATANKLTATITPNTQRLSPILFQYDPTNETPAPYSRIGSIAWHVGEVGVTFDASENLFLAFNCSVDSSFTRYTTDTEPEMHVLFERS